MLFRSALDPARRGQRGRFVGRFSFTCPLPTFRWEGMEYNHLVLASVTSIFILLISATAFKDTSRLRATSSASRGGRAGRVQDLRLTFRP